MIKTKNKKIAKVSFFLFLFFSFLALGFAITDNVSAYTSADMPEGYRPITFEDQGKVFGVDLESTIYFDTSASPNTNYNSYSLYFSESSYPEIWGYSTEIKYRESSSDSLDIYDGSSWLVNNLIISDGSIVRLSHINDYFSSFLYVKDIERLTLIESILSLFNKLVIWIPSAITGLITLFYSSETGLTFLGALAVSGLAISVIFLLIGIIQNFLHFRG